MMLMKLMKESGVNGESLNRFKINEIVYKAFNVNAFDRK
jgi:hypothetical protein